MLNLIKQTSKDAIESPSKPAPSIKLQILPPLVFMLGFMQVVFLIALSHTQRAYIQNLQETTTEHVKASFKNRVHDDIQTMHHVLDVISRNPQLIQAFQTQNRQALSRLAQPLFNEMKATHRITHFYFHRRDRVNFLRVHAKDYGDVINRDTIKLAQQTQHPSAGVEQGLSGNTVLRVVYPWYSTFSSNHQVDLFHANDPSNLLGYIELGIDLQDTSQPIKNHLNVDLVMLVNKQFINQKLWENRLHRSLHQSDWHDFDHFVMIDKTSLKLPDELKTQLLNSQNSQIDSTIQIQENDRTFQVIELPLNNVTGTTLGKILVLEDVTQVVQSTREMMFKIIVVSLVTSGLLFVLFRWLLTNVDRKLAERSTRLNEAREALQESNQALHTSLLQLQTTQSQLVQTEKMSALGSLVAGVAHEINNPVGFIHGNLSYVHEQTKNLLQLIDAYRVDCPKPSDATQAMIEDIDLDFLNDDLLKAIQSMEMGTDRIREIVLSLRNFSRLDEAEVKDVNLHDGIDSALTILHHRLKATPQVQEIEVIKEYGHLPPVECYAGQLNQVFMNILSNAIDALREQPQPRSPHNACPEPDRIWITTDGRYPQRIRITIRDNGPGMPDNVRSRIFDPFFTTKPVGKGTGLGLSISYQIVTDKHNGTLECFSSPGQGTEFVIELPAYRTSPLTNQTTTSRPIATANT